MQRQIIIAVFLLIVDRAAKSLATSQLISNNWFTLFRNNEIVFSILPTSPVMIISSIIIFVFTIMALTRYDNYPIHVRWSLLLIAAGASSNVFDRLAYGHVLDYFKISSQVVFNLADIYLSIGVLILVINFLYKPTRVDKNLKLG